MVSSVAENQKLGPKAFSDSVLETKPTGSLWSHGFSISSSSAIELTYDLENVQTRNQLTEAFAKSCQEKHFVCNFLIYSLYLRAYVLNNKNTR